MSNFYTQFKQFGNTLFLRGYEDGKRLHEKVYLEPVLFVPTEGEGDGYTAIDDTPLKCIKFAKPKELKEFVESQEDQSLFGNNRPEYDYIDERYQGVHGIPFDQSLIRIGVLDIEVESEAGFAAPDKPTERVNAISIAFRGTYFVLGLGSYTPHKPGVKYLRCETEDELLRAFIRLWQQLDLDIVTGWNVKGFDIPYLYNRIMVLMGEEMAKKLSPFNFVMERDSFNSMGRDEVNYEMVGITVLDYLELYLKYAPVLLRIPIDSKKLGDVALAQLGETKVEFEGTLKELYHNNWQKFIEYNIHDTYLVQELEDKLKFIELVIIIAYRAKVNYLDTYSQVRMWETMCYNYLKNEQKVISPYKKRRIHSAPFEGAYVKEPRPGKYGWLVTFDATSLYPSIIMGWNLSPETAAIEKLPVTPEDIMAKKFDHETVKSSGYALAGNGVLFGQKEQGFLPRMIEIMFDERKAYKKKMLTAEKIKQMVGDELTKRGVKYEE